MKKKSVKYMDHYCYIITNLINNKVYIGVTYKDINERLKEHLKISRHKSSRYKKTIHYAICKYGISNFKIDLLEKFDNYKDAYAAEVKYIKKYNSKISGYNETDGGDCGPIKYKYDRSTIIEILTRYCAGTSIIKISKDVGISYNSVFDLTRLRFSKLHDIPKSLIKKVNDVKFKSKYKHKITESFADKICNDFISGETMEEIATKYSICTNTVWNVLHKQSDRIITDKLSANNKKHIDKDIVINIILDFIQNYSVPQLSSKYNVSKNNIRYILRRKIWKNIKLDSDIESQLIKKYKMKAA